jgi:hypothetical protein
MHHVKQSNLASMFKVKKNIDEALKEWTREHGKAA